MTWSARTSSLISCFALFFASACGDSGEKNAVAVTVFIPSGEAVAADGSPLQLVWSLEYRVSCGAGLDESLIAEGTLEQINAFQAELDGPTAAYEGMVEFEPGPCAIQLRARDTDGEIVCSYTETMTFDSQLPSEAYFDMICYPTCPTISLPGSEAVSKTICAPAGGLILSAETPFEAVRSIRYAIRDTETDFLDNNIDLSIVYEGELELGGSGTADLGEGPVQTDTWEAIVGVVSAELLHSVELKALDADGVPLCSAETSFEVLSGGIAQVHVILPCIN